MLTNLVLNLGISFNNYSLLKPLSQTVSNVSHSIHFSLSKILAGPSLMIAMIIWIPPLSPNESGDDFDP